MDADQITKARRVAGSLHGWGRLRDQRQDIEGVVEHPTSNLAPVEAHRGAALQHELLLGAVAGAGRGHALDSVVGVDTHDGVHRPVRVVGDE